MNLSTEQLEQIIEKANSYEECADNFASGECGVFTIALHEFLNAGEVLVVSGSHYEMFDHVALYWNNHYWDGSGIYEPPSHGATEFDEYNNSDYAVEVTQFPWSNNTANILIRHTDSDSMFATGATPELILSLLQRAYNELYA